MQLQDVLRGAAEEVLAVIKNENLKDPERQAECETLLGPLESDKFASMKAFGKVRTRGR